MREGFVITEGVACAPAVIFHNEPVTVTNTVIGPNKAPEELKLYDSAREKTQKILEQEIENTSSKTARDFLEAAVLYLQDPYIIEQISNTIAKKYLSAESAIFQCYSAYIDELVSTNDPFVMHNEFEIRNLAETLILELRRQKVVLPKIDHDCILVCNNITPAQFLNLPTEHIKGVLLEDGNTNSHLAIVLRSTKIPAIFNVHKVCKVVTPGTVVLVDAYNNKIYLNPLDEIIWTVKKKAGERKADEYAHITPMMAQYKQAPDGECMRILANVGSMSELQRLASCPSSGIGLFRTEFLFMQCTQEPSEEEQYQVYKRIMNSLPHRYQVTFRTFDFNADKLPLYMNTAAMLSINSDEDEHVDNRTRSILAKQLHALLRASVAGSMRIMFPMIAEYDELCELIELYQSIKLKLKSEGVEPGDVKLGIMIETPAGVVMSKELAGLVDFFSIGTNDLTQYTEARNREMANHRNDELTPAVLRFINFTVQNARAAKVPVCICGELVHNVEYLPLFVALGLREFSVAPFYLNRMLDMMHSNQFIEIPDLDERIHALKTAKDIKNLNTYIRTLMVAEN